MADRASLSRQGVKAVLACGCFNALRALSQATRVLQISVNRQPARPVFDSLPSDGDVEPWKGSCIPDKEVVAHAG